jgi:NitT/TauT family transport system substrate-binding protein
MLYKLAQALVRAAMIGFFATACQSTSGAAELKKIMLAVGVKNLDEAFSPLTVAKYLGYFEAEGIDLSFMPLGGSNEAAVQVGAGNAQVGMPSPGQVLVGIENGVLDVKYYYQLYYKNIWKVSVLPDSPIKELKDLRGKKLGVAGLGSAGISYGRAYASEAGLDPQRDINFIQIGVGAQAVTSVQQKLVDAIVFWDAALVKMETAGLTLRNLPIPEKLEALPDASLLVRNDTLGKDPKMLIGVARALAKAYDFTMANPSAAVQITWKMYPEAKPTGTDQQAILRDGIAVNQARMANWDSPKTKGKHGLIMKDDWENLVSFLVSQGTIKKPIPDERIYTNKFIDEINSYDRAAVIAQAKEFKMDGAH